MKPGSGDIRPGDDFLLRFGLAGNSNINGRVDDKDFMAVYDHKMLWRANWYIDESNPPNGVDWNDAHPWIEGNEWNKNENGNIVTGERAGKQTISLPDFTWITNNINKNAVSYDYNSHDSPFEFIKKMNNQQTILDHYAENNLGGAPFIEIDSWNNTTAPDDIHQNYLFGPNNTYGGGSNVKRVSSVPVFIDSQNYYPYIPGLNNLSFTNLNYATGTDCVGFLQRSASYTDSPYYWVDNWDDKFFLKDREWGDSRGKTSYTYSIFSKMISKKNPLGGQSLDLEKIIPGDIVYYDSLINAENENANWSHIMMVLEVVNTEDNRVVSPSDVKLIEATYSTSGGFGKTYNQKTLADLSNKNWVIVRLKRTGDN